MERGDDSVNKKQLFVRNLAYETTVEELENIFQDIGPLKNVSIATSTEGKSKGFGFVKFALESDAEQAFAKLNHYDLHGRKMQIQYGVKKENNGRSTEKGDRVPPLSTPSEKPEKELDQKAVPHEKEATESSEGVRRSRQLLVFGIPIDVDKKVFKSVLQKISRKSVEIELIKQDHQLSQSLTVLTPPGKIMLVTASSRQDAQKFVDSLTKGTINSLGFAKFVDKWNSDNDSNELADDSLDILKTCNRLRERLVVRTLADVTEVELRKRKCRVIVRNLSFQATEQNVVDKLKKFGPVVDVNLPTSTVELPKTGKRHRDAEDGSDMVVKERMKGYAFVTFLCENDAKASIEQSSGLKICNRDVAIDLSMSKESYLKYGKDSDETPVENTATQAMAIKEEVDLSEENPEQSEDEMDSDESSNGSEALDEDDIGQDEENEVDDESVENVEEEKERPLQRRFDGDVREGRTVFVRGLPFDATPVDIKKVLGKFGKIEMALIVMDKQTGISKGMAFVKFSTKESADKCIQENGSIVILEKSCVVNLAVEKGDAEKLKSDARASRDKRNLYLANEGLIADASQTMSEYDREKRLRAQSDKKKKLQNPLFFVSNCRLSIRNLGRKVTDQDLRVACLKATKLGLEKGLVTPQDMQKMQLAQGNNKWGQAQSDAISSLETPRFDGRHCVKTAKIMLDMDKTRGGVAQSRGYGFVEFHNHAFALACLRQLNNNSLYENLASDTVKEAGSAKSKLIAEFSLENIRKVKILREREERQAARRIPDDKTTSPASNPKKRTAEEKSVGSAAKKVKIETMAQVPEPPHTENVKHKISSVKLQNKSSTKRAQARSKKDKTKSKK